MRVKENQDVMAVLEHYPCNVKQELLTLRQLILDVAEEDSDPGLLEESLRWGEPAYICAQGSTVRIAARVQGGYAMYFNCKTSLIDTFKALYGDRFQVEGNRAIVFSVEDVIPVEELKHCVALSLNYHHLKKLPMLGV